jgi:hypothetical protein
VTWPPPDWTGVFDGACRLPELFDEFEEFEELAEPEPELAEPELVEPEPWFAVPFVAAPPPDDVLPVLDELLEWVTVVCVEPGSAAATAPTATTLAKPTVAVAAFSLRRPRSRSATAREMLRAARLVSADREALWRDPDRARDDPLRRSGLVIFVSLAHTPAEARSVSVSGRSECGRETPEEM